MTERISFNDGSTKPRPVTPMQSDNMKDTVHDNTSNEESFEDTAIGALSFQECARLQRELIDLQETLCYSMAQRLVNAKLPDDQKYQDDLEDCQLQLSETHSELQSTNALLQIEKERNEALVSHILDLEMRLSATTLDKTKQQPRLNLGGMTASNSSNNGESLSSTCWNPSRSK